MTTASPALLVPPVRLGRLLGEIRQAHGESLADLVRRCGLAFDEAFFAELEAGRAELDEPLVRWVTELYGVATSDLLPARSELIIDLTEGRVGVGDTQIPLVGRETEQILTNYLALVYSLRGMSAGATIPLRKADLTVLGQALELPTRQISRSLGRMMNAEAAAVQQHARGLRRRLVVPVAGILVGATAMGALLLVRSDGASAGGGAAPAPAEPVASAAAPVPVSIGDAVVIERSSTTDTSARQIIRNS